MIGRLKLVCIVGAAMGAWLGGTPRASVAQGADAVDVDAFLDGTSTFRKLGYLAAGAPVPFVLSFHALAGPSPDSTLLVLTLSMSGRALTFERIRTAFVADYSVEATLNSGDRKLPIRESNTVRVGSIEDTRRAEETVIFQRSMNVSPGTYVTSVTVIDEVSGERSGAEGVVEVPRLGPGTISEPLAVYSAAMRDSLTERLQFIANPRSTVTFGYDTAYFYVEGYDLPPQTVVDLWMANDTGAVIWREVMTFAGNRAVEGAVLAIPPDLLDVGILTLNLQARDQDVLRRVSLVVSFAAQWVGTDLDALLSLLRYVPWRGAMDTIRAATPVRRIALWRQFWEATDPNSRTPENEFLDGYFDRVVEANENFRESDTVGWLTDRGEVYITLGPPSDVRKVRSLQGLGASAIRWEYDRQQLALDFQVDQAGFGRFTLTAASRQAFTRFLERMMQQGNE